jgi:hypothetical protein
VVLPKCGSKFSREFWRVRDGDDLVDRRVRQFGLREQHFSKARLRSVASKEELAIERLSGLEHD